VLTLKQTGKVENFPLVVLGSPYWDSLRDFLRGTLVSEGTVDPEDLDLIRRATTVDEAISLIRAEAPC